jgi:hypothetical protein
MPVTQIQGDPIATDDLSPHRGSWVAIRNGRVVASGLTPTELAGRAGADSGDFIVFVPTGTNQTLIL